jgi:hypothetical protein
MPIPRRLAVIVLGMHRSGTSAIAGTAVRLGLTAPKTMLPPSADNPGGFYESAVVAGLNQWVLHQAGCSWHDCLTFNANQLGDATRTAAADLIQAVLREEFADAPGFVLKDPRLCLTLPVWLPALRAAGIDVAVLLAVRHPEEAIHSLSRRDQLPESAVASLWLHYTLEAERASRSLPRAVIAYDDLLRDWRGCLACAGQTAGIAWPSGTGFDHSDIDGFLSSSLRHHVAANSAAAIGPPPIRGLVDMTWSGLRLLRDDPKSRFALEWLDQARATFAARRDVARSDRSFPVRVQHSSLAGADPR